jgi:phosphoribosylformimino-5-aminoimidazole carboxamide ribotide isomerase
VTFTVLPAIDVRKGTVVRLNQGDYDRQTVYELSPIDTITGYAAEGAAWLHLVDLDAARVGRYTLFPLIREIRTRTSLKIQTGGGVRTEGEVEALLAAGAERVVIGTLAVNEPTLVSSWLRAFGEEHITLALDARQDETGQWRLPIRGWTESTAGSLEDLLTLYRDAGLRHALCTDIARDGMLTGFNVDLYRGLARQFPALTIQASGGVRSLEDIRAAKEAGAGAAILGRALLEGRFRLKEALRC